MKKVLQFVILSSVLAVGTASASVSVIDGGGEHGVLVDSKGQLYAWGSNKYPTANGVLGVVSPYDNNVIVTEPALVDIQPYKTTFVMVTAGSGVYNVALSSENVVYGWGLLMGEKQSFAPVLKGETEGYTLDGEPGGDYLGGVKMVSASTASGFALMNNSKVVHWGEEGSWFASNEPEYVLKPDGTPLTEVKYISAGDRNCLFLTYSGELYSIGNYNGNSEYIDSVSRFAVPVLDKDNNPVRDVVACAAGDVACSFVNKQGEVFGFGNNSWYYAAGLKTQKNTNRAERVVSGEYEEYSGNEYLDNAIEVAAGRGHGMALLKDGKVAYWGCNEGNGGVAPSPTASSDGVTTILAHYCGKGNTASRLVNDASYIACGDNFDFLINQDGDVYVSGLNSIGQLGLGTLRDEEVHCFTPLMMMYPIMHQPLCPTAELKNFAVCDGEEFEIDANFRPSYGTDGDYKYTWTRDGQTLDGLNSSAIRASETGIYHLSIEYIGKENVNCAVVSDSVIVKSIPMPIDTIITESKDPDYADFRFVVNGKYNEPSSASSFIVYDSETSDKPLLTIDSASAGDLVQFRLASDDPYYMQNGADTFYVVYMEDATKRATTIDLGEPDRAEFFNDNGLILTTYSEVNLKSFTIFLKSLYGRDSSYITPKLYKMKQDDFGNYVIDELLVSGQTQKVEFGETVEKLVIDCDFELHPRSYYWLTFDFNGNCNTMFANYYVSTDALFATPISDTNNEGVMAVGSMMANGIPSTDVCYFDLKFEMPSDYKCGRMRLLSRYVTVVPTSIESVEASKAEASKGIYTIDGKFLGEGIDEASLPGGVYIINGEKRIVK